MASLTRGTTFVTGVANDVTADKLHALVDAATPTSGFIQDRTAETTIAADDTLLFGDFSDSNNLKRMTVANFNNVVTTGTGTAASPAIVPTGDTNTGIFFPAADTIAFSEGGTESMRIDSSGNVGIGTTSPATALETANFGKGLAIGSTSDSANNITIVSSTTSTIAALKFGDGGSGVYDQGYLIYDHTNNSMLIGTNRAERLRIDSSGNVGIGTASPAAKLEINGKVSIQDYLFLGTDRSGAKINIDANLNSGTVGIDVKSLQSSSNNPFITFTNLSGNLAGSITHNGTTTVLYNTSSDYRLKEITGPVVTSGAFIDALKPKFGYWKEDGSKFVGFLAHEFAEVSTSSVSGEKDATNSEGKPIYQSMQASSPEVMANIVAELQSIRQRLTALEAA